MKIESIILFHAKAKYIEFLYKNIHSLIYMARKLTSVSSPL